MPDSIVNTAKDLTHLGSTLTTVSNQVDKLSNSVELLSRVLQVSTVVLLDREYNKLSRSLKLTTEDVTKLKSSMELLGKSIEHLSQRDLVQMSTSLQKSTVGITLHIKEQERLIETLGRFYKRDAPEYTARLTQLSDQIPLLSQRLKEGSMNAGLLQEVFRKGGVEGLSAYITAVKGVRGEVEKTSDSIDDTYKKLEARSFDFKLSIGKTFSSITTTLANTVSNNPLLSTVLLGAGGAYASSRAYEGITKKLSSVFGGGGGGVSAVGNLVSDQPSSAWATARNNTPLPLYSRASNFMKSPAGSLAMLAGGAVAYGAGGSMQESDNKYVQAGGGALSVGGGALAGAAIGSFVPIIGTAIGAVAGALIAGSSRIYEAFEESSDNIAKAKKAKMQGVADRAQNAAYGLYYNKMGGNKILEERGKLDPNSVEYQMNLAEGFIGKSKVTFDPVEATRMQQQGALLAQGATAIGQSRYGKAMTGVGIGMEFGTSIRSSVKEAESTLTSREFAAKKTIDLYKDKDGKVDKDKLKEVADAEKELLDIGKDRVLLKNQLNQFDTKGFELVRDTASAEVGYASLRGKNISEIMEKTDKLAESNDDIAQSLEVQSKLFEKIAPFLSKSLGAQAVGARTQAEQSRTSNAQLELTYKQKDLDIEKQMLGLMIGGLSKEGEILQIDKQINLEKVKSLNMSLTPTQRKDAELQVKSLTQVKDFQDRQLEYDRRQNQLNISKGRRGVLGFSGATSEVEDLKMTLDLLNKEINDREESNRKLGITKDLTLDIAKGNREIANLNLKIKETVGVSEQRLNTQMEATQMQIELANILKNPMLAGQAIQQSMEQNRMQQANKRQELDILRSTPEGDTPAGQQRAAEIQNEIKKLQLGMAQNFNFQRRLLAEQFTAQTFNMSQGSYLFGNDTSEYSKLGSGYTQGQSFTGKQKGTWSTQIADRLGAGMDERIEDKLYQALVGGDAVVGLREGTRLTIVDNNTGKELSAVVEAANSAKN